MKLSLTDNPVTRAVSGAWAGLCDVAGEGWNLLRHPAHLRSQIRVWAQQRRDAAIQTRLNRQIRQQFIKAFNQSASKKLSVEINESMQRYKSRNGFTAGLFTRPYEAFSSWNMPAKAIAIFALSRFLRILLWPVMGVWGVVVPLGLLVAERMTIASRDAENKRRETAFAKEGLLVPCDFEVKDGKAFVLEREVAPDMPVGFPVLRQETPEWVVTRYDAARQRLSSPETLHAADFEALLRHSLSWQDFESVEAAFPEQKTLRDCACAFSVIFPEKSVDTVVSELKTLADEKTSAVRKAPRKNAGLSALFTGAAGKTDRLLLPEAALRALEPFCLNETKNGGLQALSGKITLDDIRFLIELGACGNVIGRKEAGEISRMLKDPRFSKELTFRQIAEIALWPGELPAMFDDIWKDREYRERLGFESIKRMILNADSWGNVALRLVRHEYTKSLSTEQIIELAMPENAHWARAYHKMRLSLPAEVSNATGHDALKAAVQEHGLHAEKILTGPGRLPRAA